MQQHIYKQKTLQEVYLLFLPMDLAISNPTVRILLIGSLYKN